MAETHITEIKVIRVLPLNRAKTRQETVFFECFLAGVAGFECQEIRK